MAKTNKRKRRSKQKSPKKGTPKLIGVVKAKQTQNKNKKLRKQLQIKSRTPNIRRIRNSSSQTIDIQDESIETITKNREIAYATDPNNSMNITITCRPLSPNLSTGGKIKNILRIQGNRKSRVQRNRTLSSLYKTIDCIDVDECDDVILVNDCDDSDVIFVDNTNKKPDESVILIEDDSVEVLSTPNPVNTGNILPTRLRSQTRRKKNILSINNAVLPSPIVRDNNNEPVGMSGNASSTPIRPFNDAFNREPHQSHETQENIPNVECIQTGIVPVFMDDNARMGEPYQNDAEEYFSSNLNTYSFNLPIPQSIGIDVCNVAMGGPYQCYGIRQDVPCNSNKFGSNFLNAGNIRTYGLRPIFIDGSNIAIGHSNGKYFSVRGLKICIDYFKLRGHEVTAVVPMFRKRHGQNSDSGLLQKLEREGTVIFTPSRRINGKNIVPYDDRYIVLLAHVHKGIIVSSDNFRDLLRENPNLIETLENRILNPTWMKDMIMFPSDPLGRTGPKLDDFLRFP